MKRVLQIFLASIFATCLLVNSAFALALGTNITIFDGVSNSQPNDWHGTNEDQEVEPGCVATQDWDLEGFFLDGSTLTMVGGFDFENGHPNYPNQLPADMFIDNTGDARYGTTNYASQAGDGHQLINDTFGYDYAIHFDFQNFNYNLYSLNDATTLSVYHDQNEESNPLSYVSGGQTLNGGSFSYTTGLNDSDVANLQGGTHNAISIDLIDLTNQGIDLDNFIVHYTLYCGNDNLMGKSPVPEPASMLLFGIGLTGMAAITRRKINLKK